MKKFSRVVRGAEIFATGKWNNIPFSSNDIDGIVSSFDALGLAGRVPLKLTHDGPDARDDPESEYAMGWVTKIWRDGNMIKADFKVPDDVGQAIDDEKLKFVSVELLHDVQAGTRIIPWVLDAVALLGTTSPAVGVLSGLQTLAMSRSAGSFRYRERATFKRDNVTLSKGKDMDQAEFDRKLEEQRKTFQTQIDTQNAQLLVEKTQRQKDAANFRRSAIVAKFSAAINVEKKLLPRSLEKFNNMFKTADDAAVVTITDGDIETFMAERAEVDAPEIKKLGSKEGTGAAANKDDPTTKFAGKTNSEAYALAVDDEVIRAGDKVTDFKARAAASARMSRMQPALTRAYLDDPKGVYQPAAK